MSRSSWPEGVRPPDEHPPDVPRPPGRPRHRPGPPARPGGRQPARLRVAGPDPDRLGGVRGRPPCHPVGRGRSRRVPGRRQPRLGVEHPGRRAPTLRTGRDRRRWGLRRPSADDGCVPGRAVGRVGLLDRDGQVAPAPGGGIVEPGRRPDRPGAGADRPLVAGRRVARAEPGAGQAPRRPEEPGDRTRPAQPRTRRHQPRRGRPLPRDRRAGRLVPARQRAEDPVLVERQPRVPDPFDLDPRDEPPPPRRR